MATTHDILGDLALARGTLDRVAVERRDPDVLTRLLGDPATRVAEVRGGRLLVTRVDAGENRGDRAGSGATEAGLALRPPVPADVDLLAVHLGRDGAGTAYVAVVFDEPAPQSPEAPDGSRAVPTAPSDGEWQTLRQAGLVLDDRDAGIFTSAVALANWHAAHPRCSRCGAATEPIQGGWVRRCPVDEAEHYPRTDPAVIMAVVDREDRLLLGRSPRWPENQFSVLAGFVEPGESFAQAVAREVAEEVGVVVEETRYLGNQPWPFPSSIMVGYEARATGTEITLDPLEMAEARWVTRDEYRALLRAKEIRVPTGISIASRIIERWLGQSFRAVMTG